MAGFFCAALGGLGRGTTLLFGAVFGFEVPFVLSHGGEIFIIVIGGNRSSMEPLVFARLSI